MKKRNNDLWLKLFCPDEACLSAEERIELPEIKGDKPSSIFLEVFCPWNACEISSPSQLP
jgi:hypothetical protein